MNIPRESDEQMMLFRWAASSAGAHPELNLMFHIPNGGSRDAREAHNLKLQGVKAGVPDICLPVPRGFYYGLWIELKRTKGGRASEAQIGWINALRRQGYRAEIAHGFEDAKNIIMDYLNGGRP